MHVLSSVAWNKHHRQSTIFCATLTLHDVLIYSDLSLVGTLHGRSLGDRYKYKYMLHRLDAPRILLYIVQMSIYPVLAFISFHSTTNNATPIPTIPISNPAYIAIPTFTPLPPQIAPPTRPALILY